MATVRRINDLADSRRSRRPVHGPGTRRAGPDGTAIGCSCTRKPVKLRPSACGDREAGNPAMAQALPGCKLEHLTASAVEARLFVAGATQRGARRLQHWALALPGRFI